MIQRPQALETGRRLPRISKKIFFFFFKFEERNSLKSKTMAWVSDIESVVGSRT